MQNFNINDLRIAKPCPMSWESMTGDDRTRFCALCELNVFNISEMTAAEVRTLVENSQGRICGRLYKRADGSVLTGDCPVGVRNFRRRTAKYCGAVLAAVIGLFSTAFGQPDLEKEKAADGRSQVKAWRTIIVNQQSSIKGTVVDMHGAVIPGVKITLISGISGRKNEIAQTAETRVNGEYVFSSAPAGEYMIRYERSGFLTYEVKNLSVNKDEAFKVDVTLRYAETTVLVGMVAAEPLIETSESFFMTRIIID